MSANLDLVRSIYADWERGDFTSARWALHPEIEWIIAREHPDARTLIGRDAVTEYRREWQKTMPDMRLDLDRILDIEDKVVTIGTAHGTGIGSGADVRVPLALVCTIRDGLIGRAEEYLNPAEALKAVGLTE